MDGYSSSDSNISLDSLETEFKKKLTTKKVSEVNVDTILVPFYEKDILIKVPKGKKSKQSNGSCNIDNKFKKESSTIKNYLVNKDFRKPKRTYLEMFRKQFSPVQMDASKIQGEISSISPEFGDTERESFGEECNNPGAEFFNTESYNEMYYDKLINQELNNYLEKTYEEQLKFTENIRSKSPDDIDEHNLRSISDVSQPRRNLLRTTVPPVQDIKLGGLGPDMENIKPRLERARSLQRYSEKVRMENRVRIYKKSVQEEIDKKAEKELTVKRQESAKTKERQESAKTKERQESAKTKERKDTENSYLINKTIQGKHSQIVRGICNSKSKSANVQQTRNRNEAKGKNVEKHNYDNQYNDQKKQIKKTIESKGNSTNNKRRIKSSVGNEHQDGSDIKQGPVNVPTPPVQISFLVNMGGIRPSSALRTLEAKHRIYQEKVRAFTMPNDKDNENI